MYPLAFYVKSLPPDVGGCANGPIIRLLEKYRHDDGIYRHELMHVKQWAFWAALAIPAALLFYHFGRLDLIGYSLLSLSLHSVLYRFIPRYRLFCEVSAYKEQALFYPDDRNPLFAEFIADAYDLKITKEEALKALRS